jgi:hypothetical protein
VDSLGNNVGKLLPLFLGRTSPQASAKPTKPKSNPEQTASNGQGELTDLLSKVKSKKEGKK